ncbi:MAG: chromate transporter, partial [Bacteroidales bacterium]|nr:chromate transporter [Bacteroidales bacterium]
MIFWKLFYTFVKIGIFTFGGGYAMIALIQNEVVEKNGWMTTQEFTDIVATSQITPGPVGINTATYTGYTAVV